MSNSASSSAARFAANSSDLDAYDERWLAGVASDPRIRMVDLTTGSRVIIAAARGEPVSRKLNFQPRYIVVPEGHRLARLAPYRGTLPLRDALQRGSINFKFGIDRRYEPAGESFRGFRHSYLRDDLSVHTRRIGHQLPWQIMVCVRRKQRAQVLHALGSVVNGRGAGGSKLDKPSRTSNSEIVC